MQRSVPERRAVPCFSVLAVGSALAYSKEGPGSNLAPAPHGASSGWTISHVEMKNIKIHMS